MYTHIYWVYKNNVVPYSFFKKREYLMLGGKMNNTCGMEVIRREGGRMDLMKSDFCP